MFHPFHAQREWPVYQLGHQKFQRIEAAINQARCRAELLARLHHSEPAQRLTIHLVNYLNGLIETRSNVAVVTSFDPVI